MVADLREGWTLLPPGRPGCGWSCWPSACSTRSHSGAFCTLGPVLAKETDIGEDGWGLILSARGRGLPALLAGADPRRRSPRPLFWGMLGVVARSACRCSRSGLEPRRWPPGCWRLRRRHRHRGVRPRLEPGDAGARARRDAVPRVLLRHARLVRRHPRRPAAVRPARHRRSGSSETMLVAGIVYVAICPADPAVPLGARPARGSTAVVSTTSPPAP